MILNGSYVDVASQGSIARTFVLQFVEGQSERSDKGNSLVRKRKCELTNGLATDSKANGEKVRCNDNETLT